MSCKGYLFQLQFLNMLKRLLFIIFIIHSITVSGLNFYWVGGSGSWTDINHWATTTGGTVKHMHTPTSADDVYFDANSSLTYAMIDLNIPVVICRTLDVSGLIFSFNFNGICKEIKIFGNLRLGDHANWGLVGGKFSFESQQTNNQISSNHCFMPMDMHFNGINGAWTLTDSLFTFRSIYHNAGILNTANHKVNILYYYSISAITRTLNLGNSTFRCFGFKVNDMGFTVNAGSSKIVLFGTYFSIKNCGTQNFYDLESQAIMYMVTWLSTIQFHDVTLLNSANINTDCSYNRLQLTPGKTYSFGVNSTQNISTDLVANGSCSNFITLEGNGSTFNKSSGSIDINYAVLKQCNTSGGAQFNAWSSKDLGGNTGWNIQPVLSRNLYWVGGGGNWEDSLHWAVSSGGLGGECIPSSIDNVIFDNNSFVVAGDTVTISDTAGNCHNMIFTNTLNPVFYGQATKHMRISGSLDFCPTMTMGFLGKIIFNSTNTGEHIQTSNFTFVNDIIFDGKGSWTLLDSLKTIKTIYFSQGNIQTNDKYIHCKSFLATGIKGKELYLSNSRIDIDDDLYIHQDSCHIFAGTSIIHLYSENSGLKTINNSQRRFWTIIYENDMDSIYPILDVKNTFIHKLIYRGNIIKKGILATDSIFYTPGYEYLLKGIDTVHDNLRASGYCTKKLTIKHIDPMGNAYIYKNSGNITINRVNLRGIKAIGNATFIANNSSDLGLNTGWTFMNSGTKLFWVNDSGYWSDSTHWSFSSGGNGGACIPTISDSVYFDSNSFSNSGMQIKVDCKSATCKDMIWDTLIPNPTFYTTGNNSIFIGGNLNLSPNMNFDNHGLVYFCDTTKGKYIISNSQNFDTAVYFIDTGSWILYDQMEILNSLYLSTGTLKTNGNNLIINFSLYANLLNQKTLDISNSELIFRDSMTSSNFFWFQTMKNSGFITTNSKISFNNIFNSLSLSGSGNVDLNEVYFINTSSTSMFSSAFGMTNYNKKMVFRGNGQIYGDHSYDTLAFRKGKGYFLGSSTHQYINYLFKATGYCGKPIKIQGWGNTAYIHMTSGTLDFRNIHLKNVEAQGTIAFNIYGGKDLGGNTNWNYIANTPRTLYWIGGNGLWTDSLHWSLMSGGLGGECFPIETDNVIVDINSPSAGVFDSLNIKSNGECHNLNWSNIDSVNFVGKLDIYGSLNIASKLKSKNLNLTFLSSTSNNNITTGNNILKKITFNSSGSWNIMDSVITTDSINFFGGNVSTQNNYIRTIAFNSEKNNYSKTLNLGNSKIEIQGLWLINTDSLALNAGTSNINLVKANNFTFSNSGKKSIKYYNISVLEDKNGLTNFFNYDSANVVFNKLIVNNNANFYNKYIIDSLIFSPGKTYRFETDHTQKINKYWRIRGNNCLSINLEATKKYFPSFFDLGNTHVEGDFINMRDIHVSGNTNFYAGQYSTDIDDNSGWIFQNSPSYIYGFGHDTSFVIGQNTILNTTNFNTSTSTTYQWSTGSTHDTIVVNKAGWYSVTVTYSGNCAVIDSIYVGCKISLNYNITNPHCFGDINGIISIIIPDTSYNYSILWSTGDSGKLISPYPAGYYSLIISTDDGKCVLFDTVEIVNPKEILITQGDTSFCEGDSVYLDLGSYAKFFWNDSLNQQGRWVSYPDSFIVKVEDINGCRSNQDTISVLEDKRPLVFIGNDTTICENSSVINLSPGIGFDSYLWSDSSTLDNINIYEPGTYWVKTILKSCIIFDTIQVEICPTHITMPNIFTPNGDGFNDNLKPQNLNISNFDMKIYNRWGYEIYHTKNLHLGWDGTCKKKPVPEGVYFYEIEYRPWTGPNLQPMKIERGTVTLLR